MNLLEKFDDALGKWLPIIIIAIALATVINLYLIGKALRKLGDDAKNGQRARVVQCLREPIFLKIVQAGAKYEFITQTELRKFQRSGPKGCPKNGY